MRVVGLELLIKTLNENLSESKGIEHIAIVEGVMKLRYGTFLVRSKEGIVVHEHCGLRAVGEYIEEGNLKEGDVVRFMGVRKEQEEACEFIIKFKEKEVISSKTKLKTPASSYGNVSAVVGDTSQNSVSTETKEEALQRRKISLSGEVDGEHIDTVADTVIVTEVEEGGDDIDTSSMTKAQLAEYALNTFGIELDTSKSRAIMDSTLLEELSSVESMEEES